MLSSIQEFAPVALLSFFGVEIMSLSVWKGLLKRAFVMILKAVHISAFSLELVFLEISLEERVRGLDQPSIATFLVFLESSLIVNKVSFDLLQITSQAFLLVIAQVPLIGLFLGGERVDFARGFTVLKDFLQFLIPVPQFLESLLYGRRKQFFEIFLLQLLGFLISSSKLRRSFLFLRWILLGGILMLIEEVFVHIDFYFRLVLF